MTSQANHFILKIQSNRILMEVKFEKPNDSQLEI